MSMSISIPHQHVTYASGVEGTIRGILSTGFEGHAHGHVAFVSKDDSRRYRAISGTCGTSPTVSIQLEQLQLGPGMVELASLDVQILGQSLYHGTGMDADIVLRRIPDETELLRATILLEIEEMS